MVDPKTIPLSVNKPELKLIYEHLGSEEKLLEIMVDFYERMSQDVLIGFFFDGKDLKKIARHQTDFLLRAMGARESYSGKAPAQAHDELAPILVGHFDRRLQVLEQTLKDHGLSRQDIDAWVRFENAFRDAVVSEERSLSRERR